MMYLDLEQCTLYNVLFLNFCLADWCALFRPDVQLSLLQVIFRSSGWAGIQSLIYPASNPDQIPNDWV